MSNCGPHSINKTIIIQPPSLTGGNPTISACTALYTDTISACTSAVTINGGLVIKPTEVTLHKDLVPPTDNTISIGTPNKRFRGLNSLSGKTTLWSATTRVTTPEIHLGLDVSGNSRTITADNSIIKFDCLNGGTY